MGRRSKKPPPGSRHLKAVVKVTVDDNPEEAKRQMFAAMKRGERRREERTVPPESADPLPSLAGHPLAIAVSAALPLAIAEYRRRGGPTERDRQRVRENAEVIACRGDHLLYRSPKRGETADLFARLVDGLAVLAFCPGGVCFTGQRHVGTVEDAA